MGWYAAIDGERFGPMPEAALLGWIRDGRVTQDALVWHEGMQQWQTAAVTQPFAAALRPLDVLSESTDAGTDDVLLRMLVPIGRSWWAIAAGYLGLMSVLPIMAPFAVITGIIAISDIRKHPARHGMGRAVFGIVMGTLGSLALVYVLASLAL